MDKEIKSKKDESLDKKIVDIFTLFIYSLTSSFAVNSFLISLLLTISKRFKSGFSISNFGTSTSFVFGTIIFYSILQKNKSTNKSRLVISFVLILLGLLSISIYFYFNKNLK